MSTRPTDGEERRQPATPVRDGSVSGRQATSEEQAQYEQARAVAANAYAPYSGFAVGAVLGAWSGRRYHGVNVESASYPVGLCAERAALAAAVGGGERRFTMVAVATSDGRDVVPCGACLQALAEFGGLEIVCRVAGEVRTFSLAELLPAAFRLEEPR
jgi:cytidine deaminase